MTPERFLEINEKNMFTCTAYNGPCKITYAECLRRQKVAKSDPGGRGMVKGTHANSMLQNYSRCLNCDQGQANRVKATGKVIPVKISGKVQSVKICPCGAEFRRPAGASDKAWGRMMYCGKHREMSQYMRKKDIARIKAEQKNGNGANVLKEILKESMEVETATKRAEATEESPNEMAQVQALTPDVKTPLNSTKNDSGKELDPAAEGITWKRCDNPECEEIFFRKETDRTAIWVQKKYHCEECKEAVKNHRRRQKRAKCAAPVDAQAIAAEVWREIFPFLNHMGIKSEDAEKVRTLCLKAGIDCLRIAGRAA